MANFFQTSNYTYNKSYMANCAFLSEVIDDVWRGKN